MRRRSTDTNTAGRIKAKELEKFVGGGGFHYKHVARYSSVLWICICFIFPVFIFCHCPAHCPAIILSLLADFKYFLLYNFIVFLVLFSPSPQCALCEFGESEGVLSVSFIQWQTNEYRNYVSGPGLNLWISLENMIFNQKLQ